MLIVGVVSAALAALLHVAIFWMESFGWTSERVRVTFGTTPEEAAATREMAFNQGFYNLFLAILVAVGIVLTAAGLRDAGLALVFAGAGSMFAAALVLFLASSDKRGAAMKQGTFPLIAVLALALAVSGVM